MTDGVLNFSEQNYFTKSSKIQDKVKGLIVDKNIEVNNFQVQVREDTNLRTLCTKSEKCRLKLCP